MLVWILPFGFGTDTLEFNNIQDFLCSLLVSETCKILLLIGNGSPNRDMRVDAEMTTWKCS